MHALDLSAEHLRHTQRHLGYHGLRTEAQLGDAERNPWPDNSFDLVYSFGVLHHTPGTDVAMREVLRVLRPGGTAVIGLYHRDSWFYWLWTMLFRGLVRTQLLRKGRRRLLSEIEYRSSDNDALPLVKVYSRAQARRLFAGFATVRVSAHCVDAGHFPPPFGWLLRRVSQPSARTLAAVRWLVSHHRGDQSLRRTWRRSDHRDAARRQHLEHHAGARVHPSRRSGHGHRHGASARACRGAASTLP